jgi:hypothetical protein
MTLEELKTLQASGVFHHATYRSMGTLWEGLHIYTRDTKGFRGFTHAGSFPKDSPELEAAFALIKGVSVGSYGNG